MADLRVHLLPHPYHPGWIVVCSQCGQIQPSWGMGKRDAKKIRRAHLDLHRQGLKGQ